MVSKLQSYLIFKTDLKLIIKKHNKMSSTKKINKYHSKAQYEQY